MMATRRKKTRVVAPPVRNRNKIHPMARTKRAVTVQAHREPADEHAATELVMYIENESDLSPDGPSGQGRSAMLNMLRKWKNGTYDSTLAVRQFAYLTEAGAKRYAKEFDDPKNWNTMFNPATFRCRGTRHTTATDETYRPRASVLQARAEGVVALHYVGRGSRHLVLMPRLLREEQRPYRNALGALLVQRARRA
jgi:hypothetical protein